jgi:hypothetical protein
VGGEVGVAAGAVAGLLVLVEETGHVVENKHHVAVVFSLGKAVHLFELLLVDLLDFLGLGLGELLAHVNKVVHLVSSGADGVGLSRGGKLELLKLFAELGLLGSEGAGDLVELIPLLLNLLEGAGQVVLILVEAFELNKTDKKNV